MKDEHKRRAYDLIYPSLKQSRPSSQTTQTPRQSSASKPRSDALSEDVQIAAIKKSKKERGTRWHNKKQIPESSIFGLGRTIRQLEQQIKNLDSILAAEAAEEAQKNSWGTWLLSPIYKKKEDSEEEKARKDRGRQERRIEKDMKQRRLELRKSDLRKQETSLREAKETFDAANLDDDGKIRVIQNRIRFRETREREEKERVAREFSAKLWKQQQEQRAEQERKLAEARRKQQRQEAESQAAGQKRHEEILKRREQQRQSSLEEKRRRRACCSHEGWWEKVHGRTTCPDCHDTWMYLLECPSCEKQACPKCQAAIRQRRNAERRNPRASPWARPRSSDFHHDYDDYWDS